MGRRGKGEGSIHRRKDGTWVASINLGYIGGKRKRKVVYGKTRREVAEKLRQLQQQHSQGVNLAVEKQTVAEYLAYWLQNHVQGALADSSSQRAEQIIRLHLNPAIGHINLQKLSPQHIQAMIVNQRKQFSDNTIRLHYSILHSALDRAVKLGLIIRNPADGIETPRAGESPAKSISQEHEDLIFSLLRKEGHRLTNMIAIAIKTGLREGELIKLKWADVHMDDQLLHVRSGKTKRSRRTLSLSDEIVQVFRQQWEFQTLERLAHKDTWQEHGLVFPSHHGKPLASSSMNEAWHAIQRRAGIPDDEHYRFHDLRHTCATHLAEAEVHPRVAMEILGHTNIATTMQIYTHVSKQSQRQAFEKLTRSKG